MLEADGAISCLQAAFLSPPSHVSGMSDLQIWIYLCRHLLLSNTVRGEVVQAIMAYVVPAAVNMLARWCPGSNGSSDQHADGSQEVCCPA